MAVTIEFEGRAPVAIQPFKLGQLRRAAPFIDHINALTVAATKRAEAGEVPSLEAGLEMLSACVAIIGIGTEKVDPALTAEFIENELVDVSYLNALQAAVFELLAQSGLAPVGEKKAAPRGKKAVAEAA